MSLTVTQRPSIEAGSGSFTFESRWNAIGNPILYKMQRKDFTFASITNSGGFVRLVLDASFGNVASSFNVDDVVYFQTDAGVYATTGTITASSYSAPNTLVTLNTAYISSSTGFVNNDYLRPLYGVEIEVYNAANELLTDDPFKYSPNSSGALVIPVNTPLRANLLPDNDADLTSLTKQFINTNAYLEFYIKYREVWTGSAESQTNDSAEQFYAVLGAMQIPSAYGGNMAEYVMEVTNELTGKWLTRLDRPVMWRDWPFQITAIVQEDDFDAAIRIEKDGVQVDTGVMSFDLVDVSIDKYSLGDISTTQLLQVAVYDEADSDISEEIDIELRDACKNPVLLFGRNSLGGALCWLFDGGQEYSFDYGNGIKSKRLVLVAENLTVNQWEALQDFITLGDVYRNNIVEFTSSTIKTSSRIGQQLYVVDQDGNKIGVIAVPTRNSTLTKYAKHRFEIEIEFPEVFT